MASTLKELVGKSQENTDAREDLDDSASERAVSEDLGMDSSFVADESVGGAPLLYRAEPAAAKVPVQKYAEGSNYSGLSTTRRTSFRVPKQSTDMPEEVSSHDVWTTQQLMSMQKEIVRLQIEMETAMRLKQTIEQDVFPTLQQHDERFDEHAALISELQGQLDKTRIALSKVAREIGVKHAIIADEIEAHEGALVEAVSAHTRASRQLESAQGDSAIRQAQADVDAQQATIFASARDILRLRVEENMGHARSPLLEEQIKGLQGQLRAVTRKQQTSNSTFAWLGRSLWSTDTNAQALSSVQKLAKNPAFADANLASQTDAEIEINAKLLTLMTHAMYALNTFNKATAPVEVSADAAISNMEDEMPAASASAISTPVRRVSSATNSGSQSRSIQSPARKLSDDNIARRANIINRTVIDVMRHDLAEIQKEAGGLIGSPNPNRQFWGRVLMVLALAIAATVAAVAVMTVLGVATTAFLVPYLAAIQASSMISTVLNFVAAKLTLDLNTAAAVTAVATAGAFGVFGKGVHLSGAPTQLKSDLDRAAQDLEVALKETPAAMSMRC